ncbi:MAG: hypothetical protein J7K40_09580 [candidate division Zixibacteria bacterium]|nr:hypothetical protein [candidate division Zixibacteria bacterium]
MRAFILFLAVLFVAGFFLIAAPFSLASANQLTVSAAISTGTYEITKTEQGDEIYLEDFGYLLIPGKPALPSKIFATAIPPGAKAVDISFDAGEGIILPGKYDISPAPLPRVIGQENPLIYEKEKRQYENNYNAAYNHDDAYPSQIAEMIRTAGYRKYNLVDVRVSPFSYHPLSGKLIYHPDITINVNYRQDSSHSFAAIDYSEQTENIAKEIILNYNEASIWYPQNVSTDKDLYDFVIITLSSLTSSVTPLVNWETAKGKIVRVVTTDWINGNYTGVDLAQKMRNFLIDKYPSGEWGIEDVLLVGHYDDVPMRRIAQDLGYGGPETDYYYAELSLPDSLSWDANRNQQYGEDADLIDFYNEIIVGRIPWSDPATVLHICEKSAAYEQSDDISFKKNILLLGGFFWDNDPNPRTDNAVLMEAKVDQTWMADWTMTRMYEEGYSTYSMDYNLTNSNVVSVWSSGTFAFVNWAGHGSPTSSHIYHGSGEAFISSGNCPQLNDDYPAIIFADACSNSDTDYLNIGQAMLQQGAVGFVGATKVALGCPGWNDSLSGSSQSLDYFFTTSVTSGEYTQGAAHQRALRLMYTYGLWSYNYYEVFEWGALWGNPDLGMIAPVPPPLTVTLPDGVPEYIAPGVPTSIIVRIVEGCESYVSGSGMIYYRFDEGTFQISLLTPLGGDLYEAVLPLASCDDVPEFYFSAEGDSGSVIVNPVSAPDTCYSAEVGTLVIYWEDNFETDQGWTVSGDAVDGHWNRGIPVGGGERGDPPADYDGSGQCCLTDNEYGNSDVDYGTTYLHSPTIDLSEGDGIISYALWYTNNYGENPNQDLFKVWVSNDDGLNWSLAETIGPVSSAGWTEHSFTVGDFVTPTDQIKVRFEASDLDYGSVVEAGIDAFFVKMLECEDLGYAYLPGDANMYNAIWAPTVLGNDVTYLVNFFRGRLTSPPCLLDGFWCSADINGDCQIVGSDVIRLVNYFRGSSDVEYCPDYEPLWLTPDDIPAEMPDGWPGCETVAAGKIIPTGMIDK